MLQALKRRRRERQLAGDARAGVWSRNEARRLQWGFIRRRWWLLVRMAASAAVLVVVIAVFLPAGFVRGAFVGGCSVAIISVLAVLVMQITGTAQKSMGATAEQWTASELRPLRKSGWHVINHVSLRPWDIDHVVIGRDRLIVVETKWSARGWSPESSDDHLLRALRQVRNNANDLRIWQPMRDAGLKSVEPILFLWGSDPISTPPTIDQPIQRDGVVVICGRNAAKAWRAAMLQDEVADAHAADTTRKLWQALDRQVRVRDERELAMTPPPPTLIRLYWIGVGCLMFGLLAFVLSVEALQLFDSWLAWSVSILALLAGSLAARRAPVLRPFSTAWLIGLIAGIALIVVSVIVSA